jgi:hypothetical protein
MEIDAGHAATAASLDFQMQTPSDSQKYLYFTRIDRPN